MLPGAGMSVPLSDMPAAQRRCRHAVFGWWSGLSGSVTRAIFAPDGSRIVTGSDDSGARLWDRDGGLLATLTGHKNPIFSLAFAPDGGRILTASFDETGRLWEAFPDPQALVDHVKAEVPRCLTPEQRQRFFLAPETPRWCIEMHKWPYDGSAP
jgi:WD40 repeat protein